MEEAELVLLLRVTRLAGYELPVGLYTPQAVERRFHQGTGVEPLLVEVINKCDAIIELSSLENITLVSQRIRRIQDWEDVPVEISVLMGGKSFIIGVAREQTELLTQQWAAEYEKDKAQAMMNIQQNVLTEFIKKVRTQAKTVSEIQVQQNCQNSVPCITSSVITLTGPTYGMSKNTKLPTLPLFSGTLPIPKDEAA